LFVLLCADASAGRLSTAMNQEVNRVRAGHGLAPLRQSRPLNRTSRRYSHYLMRRDWLGHVFPIRASRRYRRVGEVLAMHTGRRPRVRRTVRAWLRSPSHRALLLSRRFRHMGAGRTRGRFRGRRATIWVVQVGRR